MQAASFYLIKRVVYLSLPMAGSRFLQMLAGFFGMMMLAHLGHEVLAACALINMMSATFFLFFISIVFSISLTVSQAFGAKHFSEIGKMVQEGMLLGILLSVPLLVLYWFSGEIADLFHQRPLMVHYIRIYFHAAMWGAVPIMLQSCLQQFCYGILKQRVVMLVNLVTMLIGIVMSYVFIFGHFNFPKAGVAGLAYSFALQSTLGFLILLLIAFFSRDFQKYALFQRHSHKKFIYLRRIFNVGWPMSLQFGGELLAFMTMTMMIGWLGTNELAATQVTQQWLLLAIVPIFAFSEAAGILVGHAVGEKRYDTLPSIGHVFLLFSVSVFALPSIFFILFPDFFASFYLHPDALDYADILHLTHWLFLLLAVTIMIDAIRDVLSGLLRGLYDTRFTMHIGLIVMWCLVLPSGYFLAFPLHWGVIGFRLGGNIGLLIGAAIVYCRWIKKIKEYNLFNSSYNKN